MRDAEIGKENGVPIQWLKHRPQIHNYNVYTKDVLALYRQAHFPTYDNIFTDIAYIPYVRNRLKKL